MHQLCGSILRMDLPSFGSMRRMRAVSIGAPAGLPITSDPHIDVQIQPYQNMVPIYGCAHCQDLRHDRADGDRRDRPIDA